MNETMSKETAQGAVVVTETLYSKYIKRIMDFFLSLCAVIVLSPLLIVLTVAGAVAMRGNPFFLQMRPGKIDKKTGSEKMFLLIKFRTMNSKTDKNGNLLPDEQRLVKYGDFLRHTSLDELPELLNILKGDMAIIGPRPLLPEYIPYYTEAERHRHDVRPGLSGLAQINGRNCVTWEEKFYWDLKYIEKITFFGDAKIILTTLKKAFIRAEGVELNHEGNLAVIREKELKQEAKV